MIPLNFFVESKKSPSRWFHSRRHLVYAAHMFWSFFPRKKVLLRDFVYLEEEKTWHQGCNILLQEDRRDPGLGLTGNSENVLNSYCSSHLKVKTVC